MSVYEKVLGGAMSKKSVEYEISFKSTAVSNHGINE